ncbi:hypothetical protein V8G54_012802 [Vigna mungo]|uniref:Uncharacterized protein n=1 Tax=Vigna mungo TaxID=3915 RepID=A0AAQ3NRW3_VIGMU
MLHCAHMPTPMSHSSSTFLSLNQLHITLSVNNLSQFVSFPTTLHQQATNCILRYLKRTLNSGSFLQNNNINQLKVYSDSNWATLPNSRKYITSYSVYLATPSFLGNSKSNKLFLEAHQKYNSVLYPLSPVNYNGSFMFSKIFVYALFNLL